MATYLRPFLIGLLVLIAFNLLDAFALTDEQSEEFSLIYLAITFLNYIVIAYFIAKASNKNTAIICTIILSIIDDLIGLFLQSDSEWSETTNMYQEISSVFIIILLAFMLLMPWLAGYMGARLASKTVRQQELS